VISANETVTINDNGLYLSKIIDPTGRIIESEFRMVNGGLSRQSHGIYKTTYGNNYTIQRYEDDKRVSCEIVHDNKMEITQYEKDSGNTISSITHDFSMFPTPTYLKSDERKLEKFKKSLLERIEMRQNEKCNTALLPGNVTCFDSKNEQIMTFLRNLCKIRGYTLDETTYTLSWK